MPTTNDNLTSNQKRILAYLEGRDFTSPTVIGKQVFGPGHHSSTASPICKKLVAKGFLIRSDRGWYKLK